MNNFKNYEKNIREYIDKEIMDMFPRLVSYDIHILPEYMVKDIEFIFIIVPDLTDDQILGLWDDVNHRLFKYYNQLNWEFDFITVLSAF